MEEVELKMGFVGLEVGGKRKKGILDRQCLKHQSFERRMSLVFHEAGSGSASQSWGVEWECAGRK